MFLLYSPWKHQKTSVFLTVSGGIEMEHWLEMAEFLLRLIFHYKYYSTYTMIIFHETYDFPYNFNLNRHQELLLRTLFDNTNKYLKEI